MTAIETIMNQLTAAFVEMDAKVLVDALAWGEGRRVAVAAKKKELQNERRAMGEWAFYEEMFKVAGGKTWFKVFDNNSAERVAAFMEKNHIATITKRNAAIAAKLIKAEVTAVASSVFTQTNDGFDGVFVVETNKGRKVVTINTIYAGGYNIQCLHLRILVKVK